MKKITIAILLLLQIDIYANTVSSSKIGYHIKKSISTQIKGKNKNIIRNIYAQVGYRPLWVGSKNRKKVSQLIKSLNNPLFNYKNKSFDRRSITHLFYLLDNNEIKSKNKAKVLGRLDLILTSTMVRLTRFIVQGDIDWKLVQKKLNALKESDDIKARWEMKIKPFPNTSRLTSSIRRGDIYSYLKSLIPMEKRYTSLVELLHKYRMMDNFSPNKIEYSNSDLKVGMSGERIKMIKKHLLITGDYPKNASMGSQYNDKLKKAVRRYQKRYLLKETGMVDKLTTYYLNQSLSTHIKAIITNLDKTKLYPKKFESEHIEVNIPDFYLRYYRNGHKIMKQGVIVGRIDRPTPLFSNRIQYMVFNPTWTIPNSLIKKDLIPVLKTEPNYLKDHNINAYIGDKRVKVNKKKLAPYADNKKNSPYRFVQMPGDKNALGRVKFMFPNRYAVYLHDTDDKTLFKRRYKVYSSGCMRVSKPFELAHTLLKGRYSKAQISNITKKSRPQTAKLSKSIPVHIVYFTVYSEDGLDYFKNDIYLYDKIIEESSENHKLATFEIPSKRMVSLKKNSQLLSN